jgi:hypothetical protein
MRAARDPRLAWLLAARQEIGGSDDVANCLAETLRTTLESCRSPKRTATSIFSATRSRNVFVMCRSTRTAE